VVTPKDVEIELGIPHRQAAVILGRLVERGQAERVAYGKYTAAGAVVAELPVVPGHLSTTTTSGTTAGEPLYSEAAS
jgi:predicted transcriptional regulator of viral defense system